MQGSKPTIKATGKPYVPIPPQLAEAEDLLATLVEIQNFLRSTDPESPKLRQVSLLCQQLEAKLKQVHQRVRLHGSPEPNLLAGLGRPARVDHRSPQDIGVLTAELTAQPQAAAPPAGPEVWVAQQILRFCGFAAPLNGLYDAGTVSAVRAFQTHEKLPVSGRVDDKTRPLLNRRLQLMRAGEGLVAELGQALAGLMEAWELRLSEQVLAKLERVYAQMVRGFLQPLWQAEAGLQLEPTVPVLPQIHSLMGTAGQAGIVTKGGEVGLLQRQLATEGYDVKVNQTFDLQTFTALKLYQQRAGLPISGQSDPATCARINAAYAREHVGNVYRYEIAASLRNFQDQLRLRLSPAGLDALNALMEQSFQLILHPELAAWPGMDPQQQIEHELGPAGPGQKLSHGPEVLLLQELLVALGFSLEATELYDPATAKAVRAFQSQHKLPLSGQVDHRTRAALNRELEILRSRA